MHFRFIAFTILALLLVQDAVTQVSLFAREGTSLVNGVRLYHKSVGTGEPILILHGGPGLNHSYFRPQMGELARTHRLIFFDQRAHGRSSSPRDTNAVRMKNFVEDVEAMRKSFGLGGMNLMAHSWGSLVALSYAFKYPENLKSLILINPVAANDSLGRVAAQVQAGRVSREDSLKRVDLMRSEGFRRRSPAALDRFFRMVFRSSLHDGRYADSLTLFFPRDYAAKSENLRHLATDLVNFDLYPSLKAISAPTLIIRGEADPTPVSAVEMMADSIPNARIRTIARSGHFPFVEQRQQFFESVRTFLHSIK